MEQSAATDNNEVHETQTQQEATEETVAALPKKNCSKNCNSCLANESVNYCPQCEQYFCKLCSKYHLNMRSSKGHKLMGMKTPEFLHKTFEFSLCKVHKETSVNIYCVTCKDYSCPHCLLDLHNNHILDSISKQFENFYSKFSEKITATTGRVKILHEVLAKNEAHFNDLKANVEKEIKAIIEKESEIKILLRKYTGTLIDDINDKFNNYTKEHNDYTTYVKDCITTLNNFKEKSETQLNHLNTRSIVTLPEAVVTEVIPIDNCRPFLCEFNVSFSGSVSTEGTFNGNVATMFGTLACSVDKETEALIASRPAISLV
ncbi:hypothetical protein HELRODRAFT_170611 [Helobdella robusta]|uniref:B box-type domain-containing protein n=1 Tax=Helobdella robusta TaxID=6412 RepID=T1F386_HELRO|nr:hypothetical protein HELRODRAFT_170611 [Helobdella robusta]ESO07282.1 hypothetical protein HELRODRAFT_170611 [Helobdella robusta]